MYHNVDLTLLSSTLLNNKCYFNPLLPAYNFRIVIFDNLIVLSRSYKIYIHFYFLLYNELSNFGKDFYFA